jgi:hypothetical protein
VPSAAHAGLSGWSLALISAMLPVRRSWSPRRAAAAGQVGELDAGEWIRQLGIVDPAAACDDRHPRLAGRGLKLDLQAAYAAVSRRPIICLAAGGDIGRRSPIGDQDDDPGLILAVRAWPRLARRNISHRHAVGIIADRAHDRRLGTGAGERKEQSRARHAADKGSPPEQKHRSPPA